MSPHTVERRTPGTALCFAVVVMCVVSFATLGECQTTLASPTPCSAHETCDTCVPHAECLWCFVTNNCTDYPVSWLLPPASVCPLSEARWGVCWLNFEALIIAMVMLGGTILISIAVCCCRSNCCNCCCCSNNCFGQGVNVHPPPVQQVTQLPRPDPPCPQT